MGGKTFCLRRGGAESSRQRDVVVASQCLYGDTAVYALLLTIVGSLTDAAPLQTWLEETWIPSVTQK